MAVDGTFAPGSNYMKQGGAEWEVGGGLDILSGGALKIAGVDKTAQLSAAVAGVSAGLKIAAGETALDGLNPTPVVTGLTTITGFVATLKGSVAPGVGTSSVTYTTSGGTASLYGWKVTSNVDATLVASTGTETVGWVAFGT